MDQEEASVAEAADLAAALAEASAEDPEVVTTTALTITADGIITAPTEEVITMAEAVVSAVLPQCLFCLYSLSFLREL